MPSGSRGGGGGSHGGSRGGGSSFGSSRGGSHGGGGVRFVVRTRTRHSIRLRSRPGTPDRYFDFDSLHAVICVLITLCFMIFGSMACTAMENVDFIKEDYRYYQNMIYEAEQDPDNYIVTAYVTSYSYREDFEKYYINYRIPYTETEYIPGYGYRETEENLYGYSFCVYTQEEASLLLAFGSIEVAVDTMIIGKNTDSIPLDYKYMSIEEDGEYMQAKKTNDRNSMIIGFLVFVAVGWIVCYIVVSKKLGKVYDKEQILRAEETKKQKANIKESSYCEYCGTYLVKDNNIKCPACGATKTIRH